MLIVEVQQNTHTSTSRRFSGTVPGKPKVLWRYDSLLHRHRYRDMASRYRVLQPLQPLVHDIRVAHTDLATYGNRLHHGERKAILAV